MNKHLIDLNDYSVEFWNEILELAHKIMENPERYDNECSGKVLATLFYEPSTRTQMSFQAAMMRLGGSTVGFDNPGNCSVAKGESLKDTTKVISGYSDVLVIRHNVSGSAKEASLTSECPVINAGDGSNLHPTQTLADLLTLKEERGRLNNYTVGVCGDLKNGRTVHSLCKAMACYDYNKFVLISSPELALPENLRDELEDKGVQFSQAQTLAEALPELDVLYMTRIQAERIDDKNFDCSTPKEFVLTAEKLKMARSDLAILHPLPRVDEITVDVDDDPRALYFTQTTYGMYVRMALILKLITDN
ncbi:MAG: aspartate carbamoyltransferase [Oscillospiraceae bacterium]|jgi:aspartate carbamoyltransferase catalytic subunit|nr:aspartate carbamoyltransferase [Oscillospiraceae bacterium]